MLRFLAGLAVASSLFGTPAAAAEPAIAAPGHSLFVWAGDRDKKDNDFLLVIDADPGSPNFGRMITSLKTDQQTVRPHHTEYTMPASGMLFANDHDAGRSFILDVRDPMLQVFLQTSANRLTDVRRHVARQCFPGRLEADDGAEDFGHVLAVECALARQHLEQHRAKGPHVRAGVHRPALGLLGGHVRGGSKNHSDLRHRR